MSELKTQEIINDGACLKWIFCNTVETYHTILMHQPVGKVVELYLTLFSGMNVWFIHIWLNYSNVTAYDCLA